MVALLAQDAPRAMYLMDVETGEKAPDWNVVVLHDGQIFRMKANYQYHVRFTEVMDVETGRQAVKSYAFGPPDPSAPIMGHYFIDLGVMPAAYIVRLEGWNYNINPYTARIYKRTDNSRQE